MIIVLTGVRMRYQVDVDELDHSIPICTFRSLYSVPKCEYNKDTIKHLVASVELNEPVEITDVQVYRNSISFNLFYLSKVPLNYKNLVPYRRRFFNE